ncbi:hypothetical protein LAZ40_01505 [Cereibacter sphaeroides]|uniref:hypothetical protein n=1 Tax=Cereibacter sphaeroides TaxID=1063 RepID=UPI001F163659|nr:hypothetical protein [Cereibacter sphaeroides]MCE6957736.1 hypothetical protein [Cereibacter sphaeroides]MCE6971522.1 hypothetical protein [Cereibacter sphaeroides]
MAICETLPELCFALHPDDGRIICLRLGQSGYWEPTNAPEDPAGQARAAWVDRRNRELQVTPAQREAMIAGSLFGWHLPIADPDRFPNATPYVAN